MIFFPFRTLFVDVSTPCHLKIVIFMCSVFSWVYHHKCMLIRFVFLDFFLLSKMTLLS